MTLRVESGSLFSCNPRTGDVIGEFHPTPTDDLPALLEKSRTAFEGWSAISLKTRLELFRKAYRQFYKAHEEVSHLISEETGKPLVEALSSEVLPVLDAFKYYLRNIPKFLESQKVKPVNPLFKLRRGIVNYEPLGVVSPWNYPFLLAMQHIIPAILAGNVVIHKPSEHTTLTGLKIREIFDRAYLPKGVLEIVTGLADVGQALVNTKLDKIMFTGSTAVGRKIYQAAAENLVPVNMELGGSDPMIVLQDADIERAVNAAVWGAFTNTGQACLSVERLYVHETILERFVEKLVARTRQLDFNKGDNESYELSSLAHESQYTKIKSLIQDAAEKGAVIHCGGKERRDLGPWVFEPTILSGVNKTMEITRSEVFGPVLQVFPFMSDDEAVFLANDSPFGLSASIWTKDLKKGSALARRIEAATVLVNELHIHAAQFEAPYSGAKDSGIGVSHGPWGVLEVVRPKYINTDYRFGRWFFRILGLNIWWFPYEAGLLKDLKTLTELLHGNSVLTKLRAIPNSLRAFFSQNKS